MSFSVVDKCTNTRCDKWSADEPFCSLKKLCGIKLISDVCLIRKICTAIPKSIFYFLLSLAVEEERSLPLSHLLKYYPGDTLILKEKIYTPQEGIRLPSTRERGYAFYETNPISQVYVVVLLTFRAIIEGKHPHSNLHILDLKEVPFYFPFVKLLWRNITDETKGTRSQCEYVLRINLTMRDNIHLKQLCSLKTMLKEKKTIIKLELVSLHFSFCSFNEPEYTKLLDELNLDNELEYLSLHFCSLQFSDVFLKIEKFSNLKAIDLSHSGLNFSSDVPSLEKFSRAIHKLVHVSHINLKDCKISHCLRTLFQRFCEADEQICKRQKTEEQLCCPAHRAKLQHLNLSGCDVKSDDLVYLSTSPLSKSLVYLNLTYYNDEIDCLTELLSSMCSTLITLSLSYLMHDPTNLHPLFSVLTTMTKLRFLDLRGMRFINEDDVFQSKLFMLQNMPALEKIALCSYVMNIIRSSVKFGSIDLKFHTSVNSSKYFKHNNDVLEFLNYYI